MKVKLYGTNNCKSCDILYSNLKEAISKIHSEEITLEKVTSILEISSKQIVDIPALEIDGKIISEGVVYNVDNLIKILNNSNSDVEGINSKFICDEKGCRFNDKE